MAGRPDVQRTHSVIVDDVRIEQAELPGGLRSWFQVLDGQAVLFLRPDVYCERILRPLAVPVGLLLTSSERLPAPRPATP
jgi:hypothetical protein